MHNIQRIFLAIIFITTSLWCQQNELMIDLKGKWKFSIGDDMRWAQPSFNTSPWETIYAPSSWENQGFYGYNGYAWYRKNFYCPTKWYGNTLVLRLGNIDDVDEVYLNGTLIGKTGSFPPDYATAYNFDRNYTIPTSCLHFGGDNVIAVRIYDGELEGGLLRGELGIYSTGYEPIPEYNLTGLWKFKLGDRINWKDVNFDDQKWGSISVPSFWEDQGYPDYDGVAWYRKKFTIPNNLKNKKLVLVLGKIDDLDEVFINGIKIGSTGIIKDPPMGSALEQYWQMFRGYYIPDEVLYQNKENVIAVRVYDGYIKGGIYSGPVGLMTQTKYIDFWKTQKRKKSFWEWLIRN